ncbi:urea ABC transporter permease subunit UrtC [Bacillus subtilis]|uniref:urea ABC transporter permease subunit UrtC n=1 Tax=Bacillus subtilis TaxID=1423 RepID=UPI002DBEBBE1|nr:urea ABC transporter permease subunit UrtC [Bacillus subtilis]MEC2274843.1 urea ABC transporter permease subunit UrtC [Bacillus subtilis]
MKRFSQFSPYLVMFALFISAPFFLQEFRLGLLAKFLCFAIVAVGICLIWGYTGILSLGHGVFFGLGAYCMAMYLKIEASPSGIPDFMEWTGVSELPWIWAMFRHPFSAIAAAVIVPVFLAFLLGYFTFRNNIKGVYFSLISQAVVVVVVTLFIGSQDITGGTNGLTNFFTVFQYALADPAIKQILYFTTVFFLGVSVMFALFLTRSRFGRLLQAVRDGESRVRFFGYHSTVFKVFIYCVSAAMAGIAGMLFVLQDGMISPEMMGIIPSVEMVLWVAIGGRHSIFGVVLGALLTNCMKSYLSEYYPDIWLYFLGALFIIVVLYMPKGIVGLFEKIRTQLSSSKKKGAATYETDTYLP